MSSQMLPKQSESESGSTPLQGWWTMLALVIICLATSLFIAFAFAWALVLP